MLKNWENWKDCTTDPEDAGNRLFLAQMSLSNKGILLDKNSPTLEIGYGNGVFIDYLQGEGFSKIVGIDKNPRHGNIFPTLKVAQGDISDMPFEDNSFSTVFSHFVFDSSVYRQDIQKMLSEVHRVLTPNGVYIASEAIEAVEIKTYIDGLRDRANTLIQRIGEDIFIKAQCSKRV